MFESYYHSHPGYQPLLVRDGWQIAQLNYEPELRAEAIDRMERHNHTDEVFILCRGTSILVTADLGESGRFEAVPMQPGVTYNIPVGVCHNIAMQPDDLVIIVERNLTHRTDVEYRSLSPGERAAWSSAIARIPTTP